MSDKNRFESFGKACNNLFGKAFNKDKSVEGHQKCVGIAVKMKRILNLPEFRETVGNVIDARLKKLTETAIDSADMPTREESRCGAKAIRELLKEFEDIIKQGEDSAKWLEKYKPEGQI